MEEVSDENINCRGKPPLPHSWHQSRKKTKVLYLDFSLFLPSSPLMLFWPNLTEDRAFLVAQTV